MSPPGELLTGHDTDLVQLDQDHPGFRDPVYRKRRNDIAKIAMDYRVGDPIPVIQYTPTENSVWATALENLAPLHRRYACPEFLECFPKMHFQRDRIAQLTEMNERMKGLSGFQMVPVAGLVTPRLFMAHLAEDLFLATQYVRHQSAPLYTPEPDVIHELIGHASLLAHPIFAEMNRLFGEATLRADEPTTEKLIRLYWYTLEFGVVRDGDALKVVGAGLLSSFGELGGFEKRAQLKPLDLDEIAVASFNPTEYQGTLFVASSTAALMAALKRYLGRIIDAKPRAAAASGNS